MKSLLSIILGLLISTIIFGQNPYVLVLGTAQDGGYPQADCKKSCCNSVWNKEIKRQSVSCIALVDPVSKEQWIFDATPDFTLQLHQLTHESKNENLSGIFLTHAHMGHYTGLLNLGREAMGTKDMAVYTMPKMKIFLETNGPWSQLVSLRNIAIKPIADQEIIQLNERIKVKSFRVPHRDEFSETVGYQIITKDKSVIFIPDIDKWQKWEQGLTQLVNNNDFLLLDGTFYREGEINRPMSEVPHPFVIETMELLKDLPLKERNKVQFIHLNHTNPISDPKSSERKAVIKKGFGVVSEGQKIGM